MKKEYKHWFDLEKKERKEYKKLWNKSPWRKAANQACFSESYFINILMVIAELIFGLFILSLYNIIELEIRTLGLILIFSLVVFIPAFLITSINKEEVEFTKWLREKFNVIKN